MITYSKGFSYKLKDPNNLPGENYQYEDESFFRNTILQIDDDNEQNHPKQLEDGYYGNFIVNTIRNKKNDERIEKYIEKNIAINKKFYKFKPTYDFQKPFIKHKMNPYFRDERLKMKTFINNNDGHLSMAIQEYSKMPKTKRGLSLLARWRIFSMLPSENPYYTPHRVFPEKAQRNFPTLYLKNDIISAKTRTFLRPLGAPLRWG